MIEPFKVYQLEELAEAIGVKPRTIRDRASKGDYPSIKFHGKYYFYGADIIAAIRKLGTPNGNPSDWKP